jgi:hypothetical protein
MKTLFAAVAPLAALAACLAVPVGHAASPPPSGPLVVHEWGTFTSFSGSDGVPVGFEPDNSDLPPFVYRQQGEASKAVRLSRGGTVSMETPVVYFYADRPVRASVRVGFPAGWITEWYPAAAAAPARTNQPPGGQHIRWDVRLLPGEPVRFPGKETNEQHYHRARETDAVPVEVEVPVDRRGTTVRGREAVQQEKFLFYRGVGTFPTPVQVRALGGGAVRVTNRTDTKLTGLVLVSVRGRKVGFRPLDDLASRSDVIADLAAPAAGADKLADLMERRLTAAGLYEKEARAMVRTWEVAWFGEEGDRLLYLVPRGRTDELLPMTVTPTPAEVVRVLVGRHDFLTPERESAAEKVVARAKAARAELEAAEREIQAIGRFAGPVRQISEQRLGGRTPGRSGNCSPAAN